MSRTFIFILLSVWPFCAAGAYGAAPPDEQPTVRERYDIPYGVINAELIPTAYSGSERFRYDVSYTGGFKLGELYLEVQKLQEEPDTYAIVARVTTENGIFSALYPIEDVHLTKVRGPRRLPFYYEVWQKEGFNYEAHRIVRYDQDEGKVFYRHNDKPEKIFEVGAVVQNEFSSFFASRVMDLEPGNSFVVPTFADDRRNEVVVVVRDEEMMEKTVLGDVAAVVVEPVLKFSGLYDKRGDTVIWYTNDVCRVPVQVNSKLLIGSLTARLVAYSNPHCPQYDGSVLEKYRDELSATTTNQ